MKNTEENGDSGKTAVVTGASGGVGRAVARELGQRGYRVALLARGRRRLESAAQEVESLGGVGLPLPTDVSDAAQVERAAIMTERLLGPIDVWINDAMVTVFSRVKEMRPEEYERVTRVTYLGTVNGTLTALARMAPRGKGQIIQVGSALSYVAIPLQSAYCAAKFAVRGFTESLRAELLHDKSPILLTMVQLPALNTPQFSWSRVKTEETPQPVPPIYQPEVAARAIVGAIGKKKRELWVGGSTVKAILGTKFVWWALDRYRAGVGWESQLTGKEVPSSRQDNLETPPSEDRGAHGPFDEEAKERSIQSDLVHSS